jgi:hypothetical protein
VYATLLSPPLDTSPDHIIILDLINRIIFGEEYSLFKGKRRRCVVLLEEEVSFVI